MRLVREPGRGPQTWDVSGTGKRTTRPTTKEPPAGHELRYRYFFPFADGRPHHSAYCFLTWHGVGRNSPREHANPNKRV